MDLEPIAIMLQLNPLSPIACSKAWGKFAASIGMPEVTFHALRHTHASQLIDAYVDIVTISKRLGHAKPDITLRVYAHLLRKDDSKAAAAINAILGNRKIGSKIGSKDTFCSFVKMQKVS